MTPRVYEVRTVDGRLREALGRLLPQLSPALAVPSDAALRAMIVAPRTHLLAAELDGAVVGTLTLVAYEALSGGKAWIEDVVVDAAARGRGVGEALLREALVVARREGIRRVQLTSRPSRAAAHGLYRKAGFVTCDTTLFRLDTEA